MRAFLGGSAKGSGNGCSHLAKTGRRGAPTTTTEPTATTEPKEYTEQFGRLALHGSVSLTRKQRGEMAEAAFLAKAAGLGFRVSKPWGESSRYDLIVDNGQRLLRVQVKSAHRAGEYGGYTFHAHGNTACVYRSSEIDLLAAYVVPVEAWYLFPVEEFRKCFRPAGGGGRSLRSFGKRGGW
jgi:PD-(D/E)XK nuclease superfamily protein